MDITFAQKIRELRKKKGLSVQQLAKAVDVNSPGYISKIEARGEIPSPEMIIKLADVLDAEAEDLIETAKKEKSNQAAQSVQQKYDNAFTLYRKIRKK